MTATWRLAAVGATAALVLAGGLATVPAQAAPKKKPVDVVAVGDMACEPNWPGFNRGIGSGNDCRQRWTAAAAASVDPDLVLSLGDNQYETGLLADYRAVFDTTYGRFLNRTDRTANRLWPVPGNHEYGDDAPPPQRAAGYWAYFNGGTTSRPKKSGVAGTTYRGWYRREVGAWTLLALNANCTYLRGGCGPGSPQYRWLARQLRQGTKECTLAYWHQPLFNKGKEQAARYTRPWWRLLVKARADIVLNGHDHTYQRFPRLDERGRRDPAGPMQFIVGAGGHSIVPFGPDPGGPAVAAKSDTTAGVLHLTLADGSFDWDYVRATYPGNGTFGDSGSGNCR